MLISHNRRLKQPRTRTVIDPITNQRVFYSDYLKMEEERSKNTETDDNVDTMSESTPKRDNFGDDDEQGWSSEDDNNADIENEND